MDAQTTLLFLLGLGFLIGGADLLVRGAVSISSALGISPLVIGLTVVALGTASPELAVSIEAARGGHSDISVGNIVGSNILNVLLILGLSALVVPLKVAEGLIRLEVPIMIGVSVLLYLLCLDGRISPLDGAIMGLALVAYLYMVARYSGKKKGSPAEIVTREIPPPSPRSKIALILPAGTFLIGLAALYIGTPWFTNGAVAFARALGVSELVISLTVVSIGTSLPELATSVLASMRGERDLAVGNVVGSNIFNILAVLGIASVVANGIDVSATALRFDLPIMIAVAFICMPVFYTRQLISRREGFLFLGYYSTYTAYLILSATRHQSVQLFSRIAVIVLPLTLIPLLIGVVRHARNGKRLKKTGANSG